MPDPDLSACGLIPGVSVLAAVSGGADSLALLYSLYEQGLPLIVASFNHRLRPEAAAEQAYVRNIARRLDLPFVGGEGDVGAHAAAQGLSTEEAARELRYRFLFSAARQAGVQAVATGHTADDQAETVLMHFLRGAGLSGLKGMPARVLLPAFDGQIPLVRPLLAWSRADTVAFCRARRLRPRSDPSNADTLYFRNRLRHAVLPILEEYNPNIRQTLAKTALALQGDHELLEELTHSAWESAIRASGPGFIGFDLTRLQAMTPALRRNLFRRAAFQLLPNRRDIDFEALNRAASLAPAWLAGGLHTEMLAGALYLLAGDAAPPVDDWPQIRAAASLIPGRFELGSGWTLTCDLREGDDLLAQARANRDAWSAWLDVPPGAEVISRPAASGDRFEPLGMPRQTTRLADLFINLKIPHRIRRNWPLVCVESEIAWVAGLRMSERFKLTPQTRRALFIRIVKK